MRKNILAVQLSFLLAFFSFMSTRAGCSPVPDFEADQVLVSPNVTVTFTDKTINDNGTETYAWAFEGGTPPDTTGIGPHHIAYSKPGAYDVTLTVTCEGTEYNETKINYIIVAPVGIHETNNQSNFLILSPNPAKDLVQVNYSLSNRSTVNLEIYNIAGQKIVSYINTTQDKGNYLYHFNTKEEGLSSGQYFVRMIINDKTTTQKFIIE